MKTTLLAALATTALCAVPGLAQDKTAGDAGSQHVFVTDVPYPDEFDQTAYGATDGEQIYNTLCAGCHMPDGGGAIGAGAYPALRKNSNLEYAGYPITLIVNGQAAMPSLGHLLTDDQIVAVVSYIQANLDNGYEPDATPEMVADARPAEQLAQMSEHEVETADDATYATSDTDTKREDAADGTKDGGAGDGTKDSGATPDTAASSDMQGDAGVTRHKLPNSDFPILQAVEIPADATLVYLSGTVPQVVDDSAAEGSPERFGDTAAQTASTMRSIETKLEALDLGIGDVVKMQVYLVAPKGADGMDFDGFMEGYTQFFGTDDQPNLPTRSVFEVAGLANPAWLVEIEVVAVRD